MRQLAKTLQVFSFAQSMRCVSTLLLAFAVSLSGLSFSIGACECSAGVCCRAGDGDSCCSETTCCESESECSCCQTEGEQEKGTKQDDSDSTLACCSCECCGQLTVAATPSDLSMLLAKVTTFQVSATLTELLPPQVGARATISASADCPLISSSRVHALHCVWLI